MKTQFFVALCMSCTLIFSSCQKTNIASVQIEKKGPVVPDDPQLKPDCDTRTANETIEEENHDVPLLNSDDAYLFRDNFMENYALGQQYIDYYYTISENSNDFSMWVNHFSECYDFAVATFDVANILENGDGNSVVISTAYHQMAVDMINLYRSYASGDFLDVLDAIEEDLDLFLGLTKDELIDILEN